MKIHGCSSSFVFAVFDNFDETRVRVRSCSTFSRQKRVRVRSCSIIFEKYVFVIVHVRANTNEHQCSLYMCSCSFIPCPGP